MGHGHARRPPADVAAAPCPCHPATGVGWQTRSNDVGSEFCALSDVCNLGLVGVEALPYIRALKSVHLQVLIQAGAFLISQRFSVQRVGVAAGRYEVLETPACVTELQQGLRARNKDYMCEDVAVKVETEAATLELKRRVRERAERLETDRIFVGKATPPVAHCRRFVLVLCRYASSCPNQTILVWSGLVYQAMPM